MTVCDTCGTHYMYDPRNHRCPGEWAAMCAEAGLAPMDRPTTTWVDECMAKQGKGHE